MASAEFFKFNSSKKKYQCSANAYKYIDKDTGMCMIYMPSFEISGYGDTLQEANTILMFNLEALMDYLGTLSPKKLNEELVSLGWKRTLFNKEYSHLTVDATGKLKDITSKGPIEVVAISAL